MGKIGITGSSGLIGKVLTKKLEELGYDVYRLIRKIPTQKNEIYFNAKELKVDSSQLEGFECIINLAGSPIDQRWTEKNKAEIYQSRIETTKFLVDTLNNLKQKPELLISSSAIGYYDSTNNNLTEESPAGSGFLAKICKDWEKEAHKFNGGVSICRIAVVLSPNGGALKKMILPFSLGLGATLGKGNQLMSCISIEDVVNSFIFLIQKKLTGIYNLTSATPVTNLDFSKELAKKYKKSIYFIAPEFLLKFFLGKDFSQEMLLASFDVKPNRLLNSGFLFKDPSPLDFIKKF